MASCCNRRTLCMAPMKKLAWLAVAGMAVLHFATAHEGCIHGKKVLRKIVRAEQEYASVPTNRREADAQFKPIRVTFDFSNVESNNLGQAQQDYVKGIMNRAKEWLQKALKVRPVVGNLKFWPHPSTGGSDCGDAALQNTPSISQYITTGAPDTDVLIFVLSDASVRETCSGGKTLAYASHCRQDTWDRPVFGYIQVCAQHHYPTVTQGGNPKSTKQKDEDFHTALHEIIHILGLSDALFPFYRDEDNKPRTQRCPPTTSGTSLFTGIQVNSQQIRWYDGENPTKYSKTDMSLWCCASNTVGEPPFKCNAEFNEYATSNTIVADVAAAAGTQVVNSKQKYLKTPTLLEVGRQFFGCATLPGIPLEDDGGEGSAGSHWEMRALVNEFMVAKASGFVNSKSKFTLALLQDSGWYRVNFDVADDLTWGSKSGCNGVSSCPATGSSAACSLASNVAKPPLETLQCTFDRGGIGNCTNSDPNMDGCPYTSPIWMCSNWDEDSYTDAKFKLLDGQTYGGTASPRCFTSSLRLQNSQRPLTIKVGCYRSRCTKRNSSETWDLEIQEPQEAGGSWRNCTANLEISVAGFTGAIVCPAEWQSMCAANLLSFVGVLPVAAKAPPTVAPASCQPFCSHQVTMWVKLSMTREAFNDQAQAFKQAVAATAEANELDVAVLSVTEIDVRRAPAIKVNLQVLASSAASSDTIAKKLTVEAMNAKLNAAGLPAAELIEAAQSSKYVASTWGAAASAGGQNTHTALLLALLLAVLLAD